MIGFSANDKKRDESHRVFYLCVFVDKDFITNNILLEFGLDITYICTD